MTHMRWTVALGGLLAAWTCMANVAPEPPGLTINKPKVSNLSRGGQIRTWITLEAQPQKQIVVERILHSSAGGYVEPSGTPSYRAGWTTTYSQFQNAMTFRKIIKDFDDEVGFIDLAKGTLDEVTRVGQQGRRIEISQTPAQPSDGVEVITSEEQFAVIFHYQATRGSSNGPQGKFAMANLTYVSPSFSTRSVGLKVQDSEVALLLAREAMSRQEADGVCLVTPSGYVRLPQNVIRQIGLSARCTNMLEAKFTASNPTNQPMEVAILPGTILRSRDPDFQHMIVVSEGRLILPPRLNRGPALPPFLEEQNEIKVAMHCLNFRKHIPNETKEYEIVTGMPTRLTKLAQFDNGMNQRGPWDQLRTWLYTDRVGLEEVQRALNPAPGEGMYVRETSNMFLTTHEDPAGEGYQKLFDPRNLNGHTHMIGSAQWYITHLAKSQPAELAEWVGGENKIEAMVNDEREAVSTYAAAILNHLMTQSDKGVRMATLRFMGDKISTSSLKKLDANGGLEGAYASLQSEDADAAAYAIKIARKITSTSAVFSARNVNAKLPAALKNEAAKLAARN